MPVERTALATEDVHAVGKWDVKLPASPLHSGHAFFFLSRTSLFLAGIAIKIFRKIGASKTRFANSN